MKRGEEKHIRNMTSQFLFLFVLLNTDSAMSYEIKTVKYNISSSDDIICAASTTDENYVGVRIYENSSACEGLDINWRKVGEHLPGCKYVLKKATVLKYNPPVLLSEESSFGNVIQLLIPGLLTPGSKIKLFFTKQSPWERFHVRLTNNEQHSLNPGPGETVIFQFRLRPTDFGFNYFDNKWRSMKSFKRQFTEGVKRNVTILVTQEAYQTFIDEEMVYDFQHVFDLSTARLLWIHSYKTTKVVIHSVEINLEFPSYAPVLENSLKSARNSRALAPAGGALVCLIYHSKSGILLMAVVVGKGSFRGFAESTNTTDNLQGECSPEESISKYLQKISRNTQQLKKVIERLGTSLDSRDLRNKLAATQSETNQLMKDTNLAIKNYGDSPCSDDTQMKEKNLQLRRFKENFHDLLKDYNEQQKIIRVKERESIRKSLMKSGCFNIDVDESGALCKDGEHIQAEAIQAEVDLDLLKEREHALQQLEKDICDINDIFKDLAGMVAEQGEDIEKAEENLDVAVLNVETAVQELKQAEDNVQSSRRKTFVLVLLGVVIGVIVLTVILAIALS